MHIEIVLTVNWRAHWMTCEIQIAILYRTKDIFQTINNLFCHKSIYNALNPDKWKRSYDQKNPFSILKIMQKYLQAQKHKALTILTKRAKDIGQDV